MKRPFECPDAAALIHESSLDTLREVDRSFQSALGVTGQSRTLVERKADTRALDVAPIHSTGGG